MPGAMGGFAPPKKIEPSKKALTSSIKLRPFIWKRVIIDREGVFGKNQVANSSLNNIDPNWKGISVIWEHINEYDKIEMELVQKLFPQKADKIKNIADVAGAIQKVGKKSFF